MSTPVTMPAFELQEGFLYVVKKGTDIIGQMLSIEMSSQVPSRKVPRLGDTNKKTTYGSTEYSARCELYSEKDPDQLAKLLGGTQKPASGGWVGTEQLAINPSITPYDLKVDVYDENTGSGDAVVGTYTIVNFKPTQLQFRVQADNPTTISMSGEPDSWYYSPAAGVGA